jgi:hypothetical protein
MNGTQKTPESSVNETQFVHVLADTTLPRVRNWQEWMREWITCPNYTSRLNLLHVGFNLHLEARDETDRFLFYLEVADGYGSIGNFGYDVRQSSQNMVECFNATPPRLDQMFPYQACQLLAIKAFEILCVKLFKDTFERDGRQNFALPSWVRLVSLPGVLEKAVWFFRTEQKPGRVPYFRNLRLGFEHLFHQKIARQWILDLLRVVCEFRQIYTGSSGVTEQDRKFRARLDAIKPELIEMLFRLGDGAPLRLINPRFKPTEDLCVLLEKRAMESPREFAIPNGGTGKELRLPNSLEEAMFGGSLSPVILYYWRTLLTEQKRFDGATELLRRCADSFGEDSPEYEALVVACKKSLGKMSTDDSD